MANNPIRFGDGAGLMVTGAPLTQPGLLEASNVSFEQHGVVSKRRGATLVSLAIGSDPADVIPADDVRACYHRLDEELLETRTGLYSRRLCGGAGSQSQGTASPAEIAQAIQALDDKYADAQVVTKTLGFLGGAATTRAYANLDYANLGNPIVLADGSFDVVVELNLVAGVYTVSWTGDDVGSASVSIGKSVAAVSFRQENGSTVRLLMSGTQSSTTSTLHSFAVAADSGAGTVTITTGPVYVVLGVGSGAAWRAGVYGFAYLQDLNPTQYAIACDDGRTYPIAKTNADGVLIGENQGKVNPAYLMAYEDEPSSPNGPDVLVVPLLVSEGTTMTYELPLGSGAVTGFLTPVIDAYALGHLVACGNDATSTVFAFRTAADYSFKIVSGALAWNDAEAALSYSYEVRAGTPATLRAVPVIGAVRLGGGAVPDTDDYATSRWVPLSGVGVIGVVCVPGPPVEARIYRCADIDLLPVIANVLADGYEADASSSTNAVTVIARTTSDHKLAYTFDGAIWGNQTIALPESCAATSGGEPACIDATDTGVDVTAHVLQYFEATDLVYSYVHDTATASQTSIRSDFLTSHDGTTAAILQLGASPRLLMAARQYPGQTNLVVYEIDVALYQRVQPAVNAIPGGDWNLRGPWSRTVLAFPLTKDWGGTLLDQLSGAELVSSSIGGGVCTFQLVETSATGVTVLIYSDHLENEQEIDALGTSPQVSAYSETEVVYAYVDSGDEVLSQVWATGLDLVPASIGLLLTAERQYAQAVAEIVAGPTAAWIAKTSGTQYTIVGIPDISTELTAGSLVVAPGWTSVDRVAIYGMRTTTDRPMVAIAAVGTSLGTVVQVGTYYADDVIAPIWTHSFTLVGNDLALACSVATAAPDDEENIQVWVERIDGNDQLRVEIYTVNYVAPGPGTNQLIRTYRRTSIYSSLADQHDRPVGILSASGESENRKRRSGYFLVDALTPEILGRLSFGEGELAAERDVRTLTSCLNRSGTVVSCGIREFPSNSPTFSGQALWDHAAMPNKPAVINRVLISAHGGYPRAYDSRDVFEADWHELPQLASVVPSLGGALTPGSYSIAVTWYHKDSSGQVHESAPIFSDPVTVIAPNNNITIAYRPLVFTERPGVRARIYRTLVNQADYHLVGSATALSDTDALITATPTSDATIEDNEFLLQVDGGTLISTPAPVTRFVAAIDGRLFAPDPRRLSLLRFSIQAAEGSAPHWNLALGLELSTGQQVMAAAEMDGRLVLWSPVSVYYTSTGGPDRTGAGSYAPVILVPSQIGCDAYETVETIQDGLIFGSDSGPKLLSRGMSVIDYAEPVERIFEEDGDQVIVATYVPATATLRLHTRDGLALRVHTPTVRWSLDTNRSARDASVSRSGRFMSLSKDGRVLVEDREIYTDGELVYPAIVRTAWMHEPLNGAQMHSIFSVNRLVIFGRRVGSHSLLVQRFRDYSETVDNAWSFSAAKIDAAGRPYVNLVACGGSPDAYAASFRFTDGSEGTATYVLEGIDVSWDGDKNSEPGTFTAAQRADRVGG